MNFKLTEEQELVRASVREFCQKYVEPIADKVDQEAYFPMETVKKLAEQEWTGIPYPVEYGGAGSDYLTYIIVLEELSRACATTGFTLECHTSLASYPIYKYGTEEQKKKWLVPMCKGEILGSFALTEPGAGTDAASGQSTAVLVGDEYVLNGTKMFISNAPVAGVLVIFASTDKSKGAKGISAFIVPADAPGLQIGKHLNKMGIRGSLTAEVIMKDCRIPKENLLGKEGEGFKIAMSTLDGGRIGIAAQALGIAQAALDESISYSKERVQFGKPISSFQAIQWMIANMATDVEAARFLTYYAAWCYDQGRPYSKEAAMARLFASECAARHTNRAVQIHGGIGYIKGHKVERLYRDAKITEIYEGTNEVMRMVIAGNLLR
ncbi:MAG: acyl-CoA dehydrogenase [Pelotomaculum sp.]|uniref:Acyl-CoA dehydrogenases n=1 Tax=Pelotomaculum thermopropionicum (strain DSM 13744 / JCM 10971 / SI) TaxID=370438 RepID=A5D1D8_PELTS|nr:acyl-CoA dehydrogenase [Pelotomaculum sp.]BAF58196.1 acyl-CoA dehydrogenases [Pelotomaculum thermopropionicum SI]BAF58694.1 acyl-CoA dehydrogenases [Pelotomaculum thermopropionicum SI]BAF59950.1 acyl-CoA dehydrogenases [Pelotomaculum thermopropionicum SI]